MSVYSATQSKAIDRWRVAKSIGDTGEIFVANVLRSLGLLVQRKLGYAGHDLDLGGKLEVKTDTRALSTGNIALEISFKGRPSGISTSAASGWAYVIGGEILFCRTADLRALAQRNYPRVAAGQNAVCALIPIQDLREISRSITIRGAGR